VAHKLVYRPRAEEDLESVYRFIAQDSPARAFGYIEQIQRRCDLLCDSPEQGRARSDLRSGLRVIPCDRSVVIAYQITGNTIEVLRIFYGGQDFETIMSGDAEGDQNKPAKGVRS
jgi:toxin ParE1/3/4